jgi:hypothetical protein
MQLFIQPSGQIRCLYGEAIELARLGRLAIRRGSHLEPDKQGRWFADLAPCDGPVLGPFTQRSEALAAEERWLNEHCLARPLDSLGPYEAERIALSVIA